MKDTLKTLSEIFNLAALPVVVGLIITLYSVVHRKMQSHIDLLKEQLDLSKSHIENAKLLSAPRLLEVIKAQEESHLMEIESYQKQLAIAQEAYERSRAEILRQHNQSVAEPASQAPYSKDLREAFERSISNMSQLYPGSGRSLLLLEEPSDSREALRIELQTEASGAYKLKFCKISCSA